MAAYILPEELQREVHYALTMGAGFAKGIDRITSDLLEALGVGPKAEIVLGIMAAARHLHATLEAASDMIDLVRLEKLPVGQRGGSDEG